MPEPTTMRQIRRDLLIAWLKKVRRPRRTLSTLLMRGWSHR